jgi:hypothetical protein
MPSLECIDRLRRRQYCHRERNADVDTVSSWVLANKLSGVHFWSLDRDTDCAPGASSATCNSYGQAGNWGFTNRFINDLGL